MSEGAPKPPEGMTNLEYVFLARELSREAEDFTFPGLNPDSYEKLKADEQEDPGYTTPIDDIVARCITHGIKVFLGKNPESGNVFILPRDSDDIEQDSLSPKHLHIQDSMDPRLIRLIETSKKSRGKNLIVLPKKYKIKPSFKKSDILLPRGYKDESPLSDTEKT